MLGMFGLVGGWGAVPAASPAYGVGVARRSRERRRSRLLSLGCIRASVLSRSDSCGQFRLRVGARVPLRAVKRGGASKLLSFDCVRAHAQPKSDLRARGRWRGRPVLGASKRAENRVTGVPAEEHGLESYGYGSGG